MWLQMVLRCPKYTAVTNQRLAVFAGKTSGLNVTNGILHTWITRGSLAGVCGLRLADMAGVKLKRWFILSMELVGFAVNTISTFAEPLLSSIDSMLASM